MPEHWSYPTPPGAIRKVAGDAPLLPATELHNGSQIAASRSDEAADRSPLPDTVSPWIHTVMVMGTDIATHPHRSDPSLHG